VDIAQNNQILRLNYFLSELQSPRSSSSKNQKRRLKKKQKEQVGGGLDAIQAAISALDSEGIPDADIEQTEQVMNESIHPKLKPKPGQIGEGKGVPLKRNQRKRAL
jgi:translation elongation factor EF-1beta